MCIYKTSCNLLKPIVQRIFRQHIAISTNCINMAAVSDTNLQGTNNLQPQPFKYFLVLDFEATCENGRTIVPQEIIEFPVLKINAVTLQTESVFHQYVQPKVNQQLTPFCTELTGIIQDMVDGQPYIEEVLEKFHTWLEENDLLNPENKFIFVTCGDWDLKTMLTSQLRYFGINRAPYFNKWINIKKPFSHHTNEYPKGMMAMLKKLDLTHEGRHHSGIDDCKNIGRILTELLRRGVVFKPTGKL
ncbi:ERI1 exoribonuclease 3-like [Mytilus edulis]|uniref:ERI1 exoribonuclease 3-like n=1 Tax=Mytilus edulis TaxID=6550 RepID=UPI0039F124E1